MYIDDIAEQVEMDVQFSIFAHDVAVFCTEHSLDEAHRKVQTALDKIYEWSNKWKPAISISKCEAGFFTNYSKEHKWKPELTLEGEQIANKDSLVFLGVRFDKQLSFNARVEEVSTKIEQRSNLISCLAGSDWGYEKTTLRSAHIANGRAIAEYARPAWHPWLSRTGLEKIEKAQKIEKYPPGSRPTSF